MLIALNHGQWITEYVEVPDDTPEEKLEEAGRGAVMKLEYDAGVAGALLYNTSDPDLDEDEIEDWDDQHEIPNPNTK